MSNSAIIIAISLWLFICYSGQAQENDLNNRKVQWETFFSTGIGSYDLLDANLFSFPKFSPQFHFGAGVSLIPQRSFFAFSSGIYFNTVDDNLYDRINMLSIPIELQMYLLRKEQFNIYFGAGVAVNYIDPKEYVEAGDSFITAGLRLKAGSSFLPIHNYLLGLEIRNFDNQAWQGPIEHQSFSIIGLEFALLLTRRF